MKKVKFVTSFYAYHAHKPFWGANAREERYIFSLITLCNMKEEIVCYTDEGDLGYNQLTKIKEQYNLDNLTIKVYKLIDNPYQERVFNIRTSNAEKYDNPMDLFYGRSPQIYWLKFDFLLNEYEPDINLYWIDAGLSCEGMFPWYLSPYGHEEGYKNWYRDSQEPVATYVHKFYTFPDAFNQDTVKRITEFTEDKFVSVCRKGVSDCRYDLFEEVINERIDLSDGLFPVAGFFGGNSNYIPLIVSESKILIDLILQKDRLFNEEEILAYLQNKHRDIYKIWYCHTFYHEGVPEACTPDMIPFHRFFSGR